MKPWTLVALFLLAHTSASATEAATPTAQLKSYNQQLDKLLRKNQKKSDSAVDKAAVRKLASELFDYQELARRALAQHWATLTSAQQDEFVSTFKQMIENNYVKQLRTNLDYEVAYQSEAIDDAGATVATVVKVQTKGKATDMSVDYKLRKGAHWQVYDVITDDVSMVRNYRSQFHKIITTESYDALLKKMRKRIEEQEAEK